MKKEIPLNQANRLINSGQLILVTSAHLERKNIVTLAWHMPVSHTPPLVAIGVAKKHFSAELINKQKEFVINIPDLGLLDKIMACGARSGRDVDKFQATGLTPLPPNRLKTVPLISECLGHIECRVRETLETGDHYLYIGEPVHVSVREDIFSDTWDVDKIQLVFHLGAKNFTASGTMIKK